MLAMLLNCVYESGIGITLYCVFLVVVVVIKENMERTVTTSPIISKSVVLGSRDIDNLDQVCEAIRMVDRTDC